MPFQGADRSINLAATLEVHLTFKRVGVRDPGALNDIHGNGSVIVCTCGVSEYSATNDNLQPTSYLIKR